MARTVKKAPARASAAKGRVGTKSVPKPTDKVMPMLRSRAAAAGKVIKKAVRDFKGSRGAQIAAAAVTVAAAGLVLGKKAKRR